MLNIPTIDPTKRPTNKKTYNGKNKKPAKESLKDIDIIVFDIQDVGARFYTYISTLHLVLEAASEENIKVLFLNIHLDSLK